MVFKMAVLSPQSGINYLKYLALLDFSNKNNFKNNFFG